MATDLNVFQAMLAKMRDDFLAELPERCHSLDELILTLEKSPGNQDAFNELYRGVHSLKGSGGTHGLGLMTSICHQLENLLTETELNKSFDASFATQALAYVDLLRRVDADSQPDSQNYQLVFADLEALRLSGLKSRKSVLIVESSKLMTALYRQALETLNLKISVEENGLSGLSCSLHEAFDLMIVGGELKELNGIALVSALRYSKTRNHNVPVIFVSSKNGLIPEHLDVRTNILRDKNLAQNLLKATLETLKN